MPKAGYQVCPHCGYYKGKQILRVAEEKENT
jgi:ribosomal protein L32